MGKYASLVRMSNADSELGSAVARHIVGMAPTELGTDWSPEDGDDVTKQEDGVEEEVPDDDASSVDDEATEPPVPKAVETRLMYQKCIFDVDMSIGEMLHRDGATVDSFLLQECGETKTFE